MDFILAGNVGWSEVVARRAKDNELQPTRRTLSTSVRVKSEAR